jgi:hypothetical protein
MNARRRLRMGLKRSVVAGAVGLVVLTCVFAWCSRAASPTQPEGTRATAKVPALQLPGPRAAPAGPREFEWAAGVAEAASMYFPAEMPVFSVVPSTPKETAFATAAAYGQPIAADADGGSNVPDGAEYIAAVRDATAGVFGIHAYADGNYSLRYRDRSPLRGMGKGTDEAPGVDETAAIATEYLKTHPGLLPEGARLVEVVPIGTNSGLVQIRGAVFQRFHSGFPEGRFTVGVNSRGEVSMVSRNMRDLTRVDDYPVLTVAEAAQLLNSPSAMREGLEAVDMVGAARIDKVEMEYWDGATAWQVGSVQPVYRFRGTIHNPVGSQASFTVTVPAIRPEYTEPPAPEAAE